MQWMCLALTETRPSPEENILYENSMNVWIMCKGDKIHIFCLYLFIKVLFICQFLYFTEERKTRKKLFGAKNHAELDKTCMLTNTSNKIKRINAYCMRNWSPIESRFNTCLHFPFRFLSCVDSDIRQTTTPQRYSFCWKYIFFW